MVLIFEIVDCSPVRVDSALVADARVTAIPAELPCIAGELLRVVPNEGLARLRLVIDGDLVEANAEVPLEVVVAPDDGV